MLSFVDSVIRMGVINGLKKMNTELELMPKEPLVEPNRAMAVKDPESILRYALDKGAPVETIERLLAVRRELKAEQAKEAFDRALAEFQAECPVIVKQKGVPDRSGQIAYRYSPLEDIVAQCKPHLQKHGFSFTLDTDLASEQGWVIAICKVTHFGGHCEPSKAKFPLGTKTQIMSDTQVYAAALTFASRRAFCNAFGIVVAGEDSDGRVTKPKPSGPSTKAVDNVAVRDLAKELWNLLPANVSGKHANWKEAKQFLVDEDFITPDEHGGDVYAPVLSAERFKQVIAKVKGKLTQVGQRSG